MVANRVDGLLKTFNHFPTPEMIAQLNQELEPLGQSALNDLELYMKAKSDEFVAGLRELLLQRAATNEAASLGAAVHPEYFTDAGTVLTRRPSAKNWPKLGIGRVPAGGRGVIALDTIRDGELIEEAPYVSVPNSLLQVEPICDYLFTIDDERCALVFGYGGLYNHANQPNIRYSIDPAKRCMCYYAKRDITPGEELTVTYGKDWFYSRGTQTK